VSGNVTSISILFDEGNDLALVLPNIGLSPGNVILDNIRVNDRVVGTPQGARTSFLASRDPTWRRDYATQAFSAGPALPSLFLHAAPLPKQRERKPRNIIRKDGIGDYC